MEPSESREPSKRARKGPSPPSKEELTKEEKPLKQMFKIGGLGALLAAIGTIMLGTFFILINISDSTVWRLLITIFAILIGIGCIMVGIGFYGFYRNYNQILGIINLIVAVFTGMIWFIASVIIANDGSLGIEGITPFIIAIVMCLVFSGIMLIMQGMNVNKARSRMGNPGLGSAQYVISIIAGVFCGSVVMVLLFGFGLYLWAVAYFLLIPLFLKTEIIKEEE